MQKIGEILVAAGIVAVPLMLFSVVAIALIAERIVFWYRVNRRQGRVVRTALELYREDPSLAQEKLERNIDLPIARIFLEVMNLEDAEPDEVALAIDGATQAEIPVVKRFNNIFDTIVTLSPLLGLLGTVLGLIRSFGSLDLGSIGGAGTTNVTSGISEALTSTAFGLVVAVFTLFFANTFRGLYLRQFALIQEYSAELELLYRRHRKQRLAPSTPDSSTPDPLPSEVSTPESPQPEITQSNPTELEIAEPETPQPEPLQSEVSKSDAPDPARHNSEVSHETAYH
jgi:biopolymer transport protein ExbB